MLSKQVIVLFISFMCVSLHGCGEEKPSDSDVGEAAGANSNLTAPEKKSSDSDVGEAAEPNSNLTAPEEESPESDGGESDPQWRQMQKSSAQCGGRFLKYKRAATSDSSSTWTQETLQAQCDADKDCVGYYWDTELEHGDGCKSVTSFPDLADYYWYPEGYKPNSTFYPDPKKLADVGKDGCVGKDGHFPSGTCFSSGRLLQDTNDGEQVAEESDGDRLNSNGEVDKSTDIIYS